MGARTPCRLSSRALELRRGAAELTQAAAPRSERFTRRVVPSRVRYKTVGANGNAYHHGSESVSGLPVYRRPLQSMRCPPSASRTT